MGVTSPSSVFSECVVLCVTCRPLTCGPRLPGATPATLLGCSHLAHHLQGCPCRPPFWDVVTLLITCRAAPAAHPSGMRSPCSPPAGLPPPPTLLGCGHLAHHLLARSNHTQGSGQGQGLPGLDILGGGHVHTASKHRSQVRSLLSPPSPGATPCPQELTWGL